MRSYPVREMLVKIHIPAVQSTFSRTSFNFECTFLYMVYHCLNAFDILCFEHFIMAYQCYFVFLVIKYKCKNLYISDICVHRQVRSSGTALSSFPVSSLAARWTGSVAGALIAVSNHFLSTFNVVCSPETKAALVNTMGVVHDDVACVCLEYFQRFVKYEFEYLVLDT